MPTNSKSQDASEITDRLTTKQGIAEFLHKTDRTIDRWVSIGLIPYIQVGGTRMFVVSEVLEAIRNNQEAQPKRKSPNPRARAAQD